MSIYLVVIVVTTITGIDYFSIFRPLNIKTCDQVNFLGKTRFLSHQ
ncbi:unnamed protein product [Acidithrix sp. C25]|nr:unnamed protein product [Acidithrix sp. C25]